ncbi:hypothetical protein DFH06DRAFT_1347017 [Mycena polygramma]|nr:hypothetical protein DFH06DRAFT_1347017 [Mycena polygramma]
MKFILLSATALAALTAQARAYQCTPGIRYCGNRYTDDDNRVLYYYHGAVDQAAKGSYISKADARHTLFECDSNYLLTVIKDCGAGNCIYPGGGNNDYCV